MCQEHQWANRTVYGGESQKHCACFRRYSTMTLTIVKSWEKIETTKVRRLSIRIWSSRKHFSLSLWTCFTVLGLNNFVVCKQLEHCLVNPGPLKKEKPIDPETTNKSQNSCPMSCCGSVRCSFCRRRALKLGPPDLRGWHKLVPTPFVL